MQLAFADTLNQSLSRLTADEQKAVMVTLVELQLDPSSPGLQFHKLTKAKDPRFASVRVNQDIRLIVHRDADRLLVMYVDHHDKAYAWAERRKVEQHPVTGAIQVFKVVEQEKVVVVPRFVEQTPFGKLSDAELLGFGVPVEYVDSVRAWREEELHQHLLQLPGEAAEALFALHTGFVPEIPVSVAADEDALAHPDSQRRFQLVSSSDEMEAALKFPWDQWRLFLHPSQRAVVDAQVTGPVRVSGSAGTGKTIVALHRAVVLLRRYPGHRVLLTTFSDALAEQLRDQIRKLLHRSPSFGERLDVQTLSAMAQRLIAADGGPAKVVKLEQVRDWLATGAAELGLTRFTPHFLLSEWNQVIDAWQISEWEGYRVVPRLGRKARLSEALRRELWPLFVLVLDRLKAEGLVTEAQLYAQLSALVAKRQRAPFDHIIIDEAQDLSIPQLKLLAAIASREPEGLFFAGDMGQRIFQPPFSWKSLGVDIRGRSKTLKVNYRTSQEIRRLADRLHGRTVMDVDGNEEIRAGTLSVFSGPDPVLRSCTSMEEEVRMVGEWLLQVTASGVPAGQIGVFARDETALKRAEAAVQHAGLASTAVDRSGRAKGDGIRLSTIHLAKGLEYRAVAVVACDDDVLPSAARIESATDPGELEEILESERQLLYVACTRAREQLLVTGVRPTSEFLRDLA